MNAQADPNSMTAAAASAVDEGDMARTRLRKRLFVALATLIGAAALIFGVWYWMVGLNRVSTDNAYVSADVAQVTPRVDGTVTEVLVADTQSVKRGQLLVVLDDADARVALAEAEAELNQAMRRVEQTGSRGEALAAQIAAREADIRRAQALEQQAAADMERARIDLRRREALASSGAVSGEELTAARNAFAQARASVASARAGLAQAESARLSASGEFAANQALVRGVSAAANPEVLAARAKLDRARLALARTVMRAPVDGVVSRRQVQVGQRVQAGASLMTIVPISQVYVDANFKEVQLARVKPGQPVELTSDLYGDDVVYHGRVLGFSGGTGSAFALIPAQNATGNWIKVVQRVPVRIVLDPRELQQHPLRVGLSMEASVDVSGGS